MFDLRTKSKLSPRSARVSGTQCLGIEIRLRHRVSASRHLGFSIGLMVYWVSRDLLAQVLRRWAAVAWSGLHISSMGTSTLILIPN